MYPFVAHRLVVTPTARADRYCGGRYCHGGGALVSDSHVMAVEASFLEMLSTPLVFLFFILSQRNNSNRIMIAMGLKTRADDYLYQKGRRKSLMNPKQTIALFIAYQPLLLTVVGPKWLSSKNSNSVNIVNSIRWLPPPEARPHCSARPTPPSQAQPYAQSHSPPMLILPRTPSSACATSCLPAGPPGSWGWAASSASWTTTTAALSATRS
jgi:hypothetical protein